MGVLTQRDAAFQDSPQRMRRRKLLLLVAIAASVALGALPFLTHESTMFKVCLFSPVKGKVVLQGKPVVGALIERSYEWVWKNQKGSDQTVTDVNGEFELPAIHGTMVLGSVLPHEPVIHQSIDIKAGEEIYKAWRSSKRTYDEFSELCTSDIEGGLKGKPIRLLCDLGQGVKNHGGVGGFGGMAELIRD